MGKSEIARMPIHKPDDFYAATTSPSANNLLIIPTLAKKEEKPGEERSKLPLDMEVFRNQVAGHKITDKNYGMIYQNGRILKFISSAKAFESEVNFYETINTTTIPTLIEAREFLPKYYGNGKHEIDGEHLDCVVLEDLTKYFKEPCVMDVKIGRRTWDPNATSEKIRKEENKYKDCKRDLGFCIPGFQVYNYRNNELCKFDKEFGKTLTKDTVPQALKTFLNADRAICRSLIVQFLASLWRIQLWMRKQRYFTFYSSSLLFIYDARRLRDLLPVADGDVPADADEDGFDDEPIKPNLKLQRSRSLYRPLSLAVLNPINNAKEKFSTGFSGQLTNQGPILKTCTVNKFVNLIQKNGFLGGKNSRGNIWQKSIRTLKRTHSFQNNYDMDMQNKRNDYTAILDELCTDEDKRGGVWATVKMIDFAHAFPAEHAQLDGNYLDGIDNLVRLFEELLIDSE